MATESPIRMMVPRGKWTSHPRNAMYISSPEEHGLLAKSQYQSGRSNAPNRSGSAPPSMEGSFAALETLDHSSSSAAIYSSNVDTSHNLQHPVRSSSRHHLLDSLGTASNNWRSFSSSDGYNNSVNLSWGMLPTHREESDDDTSPQHAYNDLMGRSSSMWTGQDLSSSLTRSRSLVDQTQGSTFEGNYARTSLPVSDQQHSLCPGSAEVANHNADSNSLPDQPIGAPNMVASGLHADHITSSQEADSSDASASRSIPNVIDGTLSQDHRDDQSGIDIHFESEAVATSASEMASVQSGIKGLKISPPSNLDIHSSQEEEQLYPDSLQQQAFQQNDILQFQNLMPQMVSQGVNNAAPTAYFPSANTYYPGMQTPGVIYPSQYGLGGYGFNPMAFPPDLSGYSPQYATPFNVNSASGSQYNPRAYGVPSATVDAQNLSKFYEQFGIMHHSFADPRMQFHLPYGGFYNLTGQADPLALRSGFFRGQVSAFNSQRRPDFSGASTDNRLQNQGTGGAANINQRREAVATPSYFSCSTNMSVHHIPTSTPRSPVLPSSPLSGTNLLYGTNAFSSPHDSSRNASSYAGWQAQRGYESPNCTKTYSFLEELKSGKGRMLGISDIAGHVVEFSVDQHGSRFIQKKLENCSVEEKASVFKEVLPHASKLMTDVFGNYVIQKFFEYGTDEQRKELANQMQAQILPLSLQVYGCRVIQKALEVIKLEQKAELVHELDGHVMRCVHDQNGNHVIQKCIESIPTEKMDFIISAFRGQVATLSTHPYGCRVIQRVLEHCADGSQSHFIVDEILESVCTLAQNQYGNYVTQHVLERGKSEERIRIIRKLAGQVVQMSQHKFASNVIEKCLEYGDAEGRELLIGEIIGTNESNDNLLIMMKDQYANYVVQKILELCTDSQRDLLLGRIRVHLNALRKYTYGKHIVARFEQLFGEDIQASGSQGQ